MEYKTYTEWFNEIKWLKDKIILPNGKTINKTNYTTKIGFDIDRFNKFLFQTYNMLYPVNDGRRYKK
jgi:hypothetical protein